MVEAPEYEKINKAKRLPALYGEGFLRIASLLLFLVGSTALLSWYFDNSFLNNISHNVIAAAIMISVSLPVWFFSVRLRSEGRKLREEEKQLELKNILLEIQAETTLDGILIVDEEGRTSFSNKQFERLWRIPPEVMATKSDEKMLQYITDQLKNPKEFLEKVANIYVSRGEKLRDSVELKDNRVFERFTSPLVGREGKYYGRIWYFRDVTEKAEEEKSKEARAAETERLNQIMTGREIKMIELKKRVAELEEKLKK